jgi:hypothetical protein
MTRCGTDHGWHRHREAGQHPCDRCTEAHTIAMSQWKLARLLAHTPHTTGDAKVVMEYGWLPGNGDRVDVRPSECGTAAGFLRHHYEQTRPCQRCRTAFLAISSNPSNVRRVAGCAKCDNGYDCQHHRVNARYRKPRPAVKA